VINAKKYEGHTPAPWTVDVHKVGEEISAIVIESPLTTHTNEVLAEVEVENKYAEADAQLIADAPKLLAKCKSLAGQLVATRAYLNDLVTFIKECELVEFCDKCDGFYLFEDGRQCGCCPSCVGEDYDADDHRTCRDCKIEFSERFYE